MSTGVLGMDLATKTRPEFYLCRQTLCRWWLASLHPTSCLAEIGVKGVETVGDEYSYMFIRFLQMNHSKYKYS